MDVLVGCESSGTVREAFRKLGIDAWSCDFLPADDGSLAHLQCDIRVALRYFRPRLFIVHPTCTYLSSSGLHWNARGRMVDGRPRAELTEEAVAFAREMCETDVEFFAMENPIGCLSTRLRKPDQIIQPHQFGDDASKATCLWLKNLPRLLPTLHVPPRIVDGKKRWANQTDSGQNRLGPSEERWKIRSQTYQGIADAIADQWSKVLI